MIIRIITLLCCLSFSLMTSAQASGGQIRRKNTTSSVHVSKASKSKNVMPKAIDLGLPSGTLWADRNVGANSPTAYGGLYRYGAPHTRLDGSNSEVSTLPNIVGTSFDVAMVNLGNDWRLPTKEQVKELLQYCKVTKEETNRVVVAKIIGPNGNYILLPLAGVMYHYGRSQAGEFGNYMIGEKDCFLNVFIGNEVEVATYGPGNDGESVRAVKRPVYHPSTSQVETVSASELRKYNVQVSAFLELKNAIGLRNQFRNAGYDAKIYFDEPSRLYRVVATSWLNLEDAISSKKSINKYNYSCGIFTIQNGQTTFVVQ